MIQDSMNKAQQGQFLLYQAAAPLCDKHKPDGGARAECLVCAIQKMASAFSAIDYLMWKPNDMGVSSYDVEPFEDMVVEKVKKLAAWLDTNHPGWLDEVFANGKV